MLCDVRWPRGFSSLLRLSLRVTLPQGPVRGPPRLPSPQLSVPSLPGLSHPPLIDPNTRGRLTLPKSIPLGHTSPSNIQTKPPAASLTSSRAPVGLLYLAPLKAHPSPASAPIAPQRDTAEPRTRASPLSHSFLCATHAAHQHALQTAPSQHAPASTCPLLPARFQTDARVCSSEFKSDDVRPSLQLLNGFSA